MNRSDRRRYLYIHRLHPVNLVFAILLSPFFRVIYWRQEMVPSSLASRFTVLDPSETFDLDEWQGAGECAFAQWQEIAKIGGNLPSAHGFVADQKIDFSACWQQWIAAAVEERYLFFRMLKAVSAANEPAYIADSVIDRVVQGLEYQLCPPAGLRFLGGFRWLDRLWSVVRLATLSMRRAFALIRRGGAIGQGPAAILWTGIGPSEIADGTEELDFSFLVRDGHLSADDCVYVLPSAPVGAARDQLYRRRVRWITSNRLSFLPLSVKLRALIDILRNLARGIFYGLWSARELFAATSACASIPAASVARFLRTNTYLTSVSACWPENPEVAALNDLGVRTINWSYGANTFLYSSSNPRFRDVGIARSVAVASDIWVWSDEVRDWLLQRSLITSSQIRTIGPVMCGDSRWCALTPAQARQRYGISGDAGRFYIALFDVPPLSREARLAVGHGPTNYPVEMLEQFFADCERLLQEFGDVVLIVKPKRALADSNRQYSRRMQRILDPQSDLVKAGKAVVVSHGIDPYIPVAMADIAVGVPFTSPVFAALASGRTGIYHDSLDSVRYFRPHGYGSLVTHSYAELAAGISAGRSTPAIYGWKNGDPVRRFAAMLSTKKPQE